MRIFRFAGVASILVLSAMLSACQITDIFSNSAASGASGSGFVAMNDIRRNAGLQPLSPDPRLERAAMRQAGYMARAGRMVHDTGWGRGFADRMKKDGVAAPAAENLAHGHMGVAKVFQMWEASTGHRKNMLDPRFTRYGLANASAADGRRYWALVLGR